MRIVCISDTHTQHGVAIPIGDVLVHAGDLSHSGEWSVIGRALRWMAQWPHPHKIFIAGNHDWAFQRRPEDLPLYLPEGVTYLQDSGIEIEGLKFWGSPWQPWFHDWAFNLRRGPDIAAKWELIPEDVDVLITHGPPFGIRDQLPGTGQSVGCKDLLRRLEELPRLKLHVFGHIHHGYGMELDAQGRRFANACICDEAYRPANRPITIDL